MKRLLWTLALFAGLASGLAPGVQPARAQDEDNGGVRMLYIIRHGFYDIDDEADPFTGKHLVPLGIAQARLVAARLRGMPVEFTAIYSSTMTRARETAFVIQQEFPELEVQQTEILRECTPTTWRQDIMEHVTPEEAKACEDQLEAAFSQFFSPTPDADRHEILVCHGNVTRYLVTRALGVEPKAWLGMSLANCSLTIVRIAPDGAVKVLAVGDVGHIPPDLQTGIYNDSAPLAVPEP